MTSDIVRCDACGAKNRVAIQGERKGEYRCGSCREPLSLQQGARTSGQGNRDRNAVDEGTLATDTIEPSPPSTEPRSNHEDEAAPEMAASPARRPWNPFAGILFGFFYAGALERGGAWAVSRLLETDESTLYGSPSVAGAVGVGLGLGAAVLCAYASRSLLAALLAAALTWAPLLLILLEGGTWGELSGGQGAMFGASLGATLLLGFVASRRAKRIYFYDDRTSGRVFDLRPLHFLWLWIPWRELWATAVLMVWPPPWIDGLEFVFFLLGSFTAVPILFFGWALGIVALQERSGLSGWQKWLRVLGWLFLFPALMRALRLLVPSLF